MPVRRRADHSDILPRSVAVLGELGACAVWRPDRREFYGMQQIEGRVLVATADGREMFVLKPIKGGRQVRPDALALEAMELRERFVHRRGDGYFNCIVPPFRQYRFCGEMAILSYIADKQLPTEILADVEWVHYFEREGIEPAYAPFYSLGHDQFHFPRGRWCVAAAGIQYADE